MIERVHDHHPAEHKSVHLNLSHMQVTVYNVLVLPHNTTTKLRINTIPTSMVVNVVFGELIVPKGIRSVTERQAEFLFLSRVRLATCSSFLSMGLSLEYLEDFIIG